MFITRKISGTSPDFASVRYSQFAFSPDGRYVVFVADRDTDEKYELYSVPVEGSTPTRIVTVAPANGDVEYFTFTPDGKYVLFSANLNTNSPNQVNLYCVPVAGGAKPTQLNDPVPAKAWVNDFFKISPDGQYVVYLGNQEIASETELYTVPIGGGTVVKLNDPLIDDGDVQSFAFATSGTRVVYSAVEDTTGVAELYSVTITGSDFQKLNPAIAVGHRGVWTWAVTPNGAGVVYIADQETSLFYELYTVPTTGSAIEKLNFPPVTGGEVWDIAVNPAVDKVIYKADLEKDEKFELYMSVMAGHIYLPAIKK